MRRQNIPAALLQTVHQRRCRVRDARGDLSQPVGAVIDAVHSCDHCQQDLRRADVGVGLFTPNMLLACLQRQAVGATTPAVDAHADQAPGQRPLVGHFARDVGRVWAAISHRHTEPLR